ncbi:hypothetical protein BRADI_3g10865v3 [Brachypodium distachyon]|uniref:Uncharacterized protein n=1 Tax=Brachypodium distachyon TaxID=15368 RepID=A0A2K2CWH3_BRADI|nr:hypothetical protein BRADI_3g10865v3 [Brachypodium distachyon]
MNTMQAPYLPISATDRPPPHPPPQPAPGADAGGGVSTVGHAGGGGATNGRAGGGGATIGHAGGAGGTFGLLEAVGCRGGRAARGGRRPPSRWRAWLAQACGCGGGGNSGAMKSLRGAYYSLDLERLHGACTLGQKDRRLGEDRRRGRPGERLEVVASISRLQRGWGFLEATVEAQEVQLPDMPPITLDDADVQTVNSLAPP